LNSTPRLTADPDAIRRALTGRYQAAPGLVALCSTRDWAGIQSSDIEVLIAWALREDQAGAAGIYSRVTTVAAPFPAGQRGGARDAHAIIGMWSDIDFGDDAHAADGLPPTADEARRITPAAGLPPHTREEHSGGGLYRWWQLATPAVIGEDLSFDQAKLLASTWQDALLTGAESIGYGYGAGVKDLARVLRLPGTINRKPGRTPVAARVTDDTGPRYELSELLEIAARLAPPAPARAPQPIPAPRPAATAGRQQHHGRPGPLEILGQHPAIPEILAHFGATYGQQAASCPMCGPGECQVWLRPGWTKGSSMSGISVHKGGYSVTVRSDNAGLPAGGVGRVLSPGQLFAWMHHGGSESAAASDILRAAHGHAGATAAAQALPVAVLDQIRAAGRDRDRERVANLHDARARPSRPVPPTAGSAALQEPEPDEHPDPDDDPQDYQDSDAGPEAAVGFDYVRTFGLPAGMETPDKYRIYKGGVAIKRTVKDEELWARFAFAPLVITAAFEDPAGEQCVRLAWTDRGRVVSRIVSREIAKRGRELVKALGGSGLPVVEGDARVLERWLAELEAANVGLIPYEPLARWLGWQPDGTFLASPEDGVSLDVVYDEQRAPASAHGRRGTLADWQAVMAKLEGYQVVRVAVAASLAASLLRPLGVNSFTFDISSRSTKGKTTALQVALSCWANPSEQADAMSNWRTTLYAIEKRLNLVRGLPVVLDETMAVSDETLIDQVLYQLPMNHGKARSGGAFGNMLPWETILLASGERPALSFTTSQGAAARILGTTTPPFGPGDGDLARSTRDGVLANFGHAGPAFVEMIRTGLASDGGLARLKARHAELREAVKGETDMTGRRAPMVAVLALAEQLACKAKILPYAALPTETWIGLFSAGTLADNRGEMAMDVVRGYVAGHSAELWPAGGRLSPGQEKPPYGGWIGILAVGKDKSRKVALLPEKLRRILADAGYSLDSVIDSWIDAGYLELSDSQRPRHQKNLRLNGTQTKVFAFTAEAISLGADPQESW
jgi:hypothetical protein